MAAATKIALDPGFGFAEFAIGDKVSDPIDLYLANDHFVALQAKHGADGAVLWESWRAYLEEKGFPAELSIAGLVQVVNEISAAIGGLRKKDPQPAS